jgi:hypothetical protein
VRCRTEIKHPVVIIWPFGFPATSLKREANTWITLLQTSPPDVLAYKSCVKPFFMFGIYWHSKYGFVFSGWNSQSAAGRLRRIYKGICFAKRNE